jgi:hypothetical protein
MFNEIREHAVIRGHHVVIFSSNTVTTRLNTTVALYDFISRGDGGLGV